MNSLEKWLTNETGEEQNFDYVGRRQEFFCNKKIREIYTFDNEDRQGLSNWRGLTYKDVTHKLQAIKKFQNNKFANITQTDNPNQILD